MVAPEDRRRSNPNRPPISSEAIGALRERVQGRVLSPADPAYALECAGFNSAVTHAPDLVVAVESERDAIECVRFAREHGLAIHVQATGHGAPSAIDSGLLVSTRALDGVRVDPVASVAIAGAGARWRAVIAPAAEHGLAPITGSSPTVGVVGYLLGGGLGPLARSHGFGSDYALSFRVVTGAAHALEASAAQNPDLFWALRGGKGGFGIVTEVRLRLVPLPALYAGSLFFDEPQIEAALRHWVSWTAHAHPLVTTSVAIIRFPPFEAVPAPLRGRRLLVLHFAYPGERVEGERLAAPLRSAAPVYLDQLAPMPASDVARIHNDPEGPLPASTRSGMLTQLDQDVATVLLRHVGPGTSSPFTVLELRHLGEATRHDVPGGSAVGGRESPFAFGCVSTDPASFATALPAAYEKLASELRPWISPHNNINFLSPIDSAERFASAWPPASFSRLAAIRAQHDPDRLFPFGY